MLTVAAFLVLLGVLITVHELGHFLVAKASGVKVLTFSIGFGPKLIGFTRGDTEYRISALPLGGYVRMYGDDIHEDIPAEEQHRSFLHQPFLKKSAIAVAGPLANLILPVTLFFALYIGNERVPDAVLGTVVPGDVAAQAGVQAGDRIVAVDGSPVKLFSELQEYVEPRPGSPIRLTLERGPDGARQRLDVSVTPRSAPSPTLFDAKRTVGRLGVMSAVELPVVVVDKASPAATAGVVDLDRIISVAGTATPTKGALLAALDSAPDTVAVEVETDATEDKTGKKTPANRRTVTLTRAPAVAADIVPERFGVTAEELMTAELAARTDATVTALQQARADAARRFGLAPVDGRVGFVAPGTVAADKAISEKDRILAVDGRVLGNPNDLENALRADPDGIHVVGVLGENSARVLSFRMLPAPQREMGGIKVFGVALTAAYGDGAWVERMVSPAEALRRGVAETRGLVGDVFSGFGLLFSGQVGLESLGGPITIAKMSGQAAEMGGQTFVRLMSLISVNLAVINLMPIPVLDGGHLLIFVIELVTRKRMSIEARNKATKIGLVLVGLLMIIAIGNDVLGLF